MECCRSRVGTSKKVIADVKSQLIVWGKDLVVRSPWWWRVLPRYGYSFNAVQLTFLCECLQRTRSVPGSIVEVGTAAGRTALFLNNYLTAAGIEKPYIAVDTFSGFVQRDIEYEVRTRGKHEYDYHGIRGFRDNKQSWFDATMRRHKFSHVRSIRADVNDYDLRTLGTISFCLLDVDLYRPMKKALSELYESLSVGGIIVVDDASADDARFDGALQAYREFMHSIHQPEQIVHTKLGLVTK